MKDVKDYGLLTLDQVTPEIAAEVRKGVAIVAVWPERGKYPQTIACRSHYDWVDNKIVCVKSIQMNNGNGWKPLTNKLARVFNPERAAERAERAAKRRAERREADKKARKAFAGANDPAIKKLAEDAKKAEPMTAAEKAEKDREFYILNASWVNNDISNFFIANDGTMITFPKPSIKTTFLFPEHTYDYDEQTNAALKCEKSYAFFISENISDKCYRYTRDRNGERVENRLWIKRGAYNAQPKDCRLGTLEYAHNWDRFAPSEADGYRRLTDAEFKRLEEAEERHAALFKKRLLNYLKRYDLSKINCSTFWADR